jgi:hypothetical protein
MRTRDLIAKFKHTGVQFLLWSWGLVLGATALLKIYGALQTDGYTRTVDPFFHFLTYRQLSVGAGVAELAVVLTLAAPLSIKSKARCVAWLSSIFLLYHLGLLLVDAKAVMCPCLGSLGAHLGVRPSNLARASLLLAVYLFGTSSFVWVAAGTSKRRGSWCEGDLGGNGANAASVPESPVASR